MQWQRRMDATCIASEIGEGKHSWWLVLTCTGWNYVWQLYMPLREYTLIILKCLVITS